MRPQLNIILLIAFASLSWFTVSGTTTSTPAPSTGMPADETIKLYNEQGDLCFMMKADQMEVSITYNATGNIEDTKDIVLPMSPDYSGSCDNDSATVAVNWYDGDLTVEFIIESSDNKYSLDMIIVNYTLNTELFPAVSSDDKNKIEIATGSDLALFETTNGKSYYCNETVNVELKKNVVFMFATMQMQLFDIEKNTFSDAEFCHADVSTTANPNTTTDSTNTTTPSSNTTTPSSNTTTSSSNTTAAPSNTTSLAPTSTPSPKPEMGNWTMEDSSDKNTCLKIQMAVEFDIIYVDKNDKNATKIFALPTDAKIADSSNCSDSEIIFALTFNDDWVMTLVFKYDDPKSSSLSAKSKKYSVHEFKLTYTPSAKYFPDIKTPEAETTVSNPSLSLFDTAEKTSYKCTAETEVMLGGGVVTVKTTDVQVQAFKFNTNDKYDSASECSADKNSDKSDKIIPIVVGCALAGLVLIVLIAYLIGRARSNRQGYQQV